MNKKDFWRTAVIDGKEKPRYKVSRDGRIICMDWGGYGKPRLCALSEVTNGYLKVGIDGVLKFVHRIVAETFIQNPKGKPCVDHVDTNRQNNSVDNLRWVTQKENCNNPLSIKNYNRQPIVQLTLDGTFVNRFVRQMDASLEFGVKQGCISNCCHGRRKSAGGFRWMFYSDWVKTRRKKSLKDIKPLFV